MERKNTLLRAIPLVLVALLASLFGLSGTSCTREHTNPLDPSNPDPFRLRAEGLVGRVRLLWQVPDVPDLESTVIFRRDSRQDTASFVVLTRVPVPESTYVDTQVEPDVRYDYQVAAAARGDLSRRSATVSAYPRSVAPPFGLSVADLPNDQGRCLVLSWALSPMDTVGGEVTGYAVGRDTVVQGTYPLVMTVPARTSTAVDSGLVPGKLYFYRVHAMAQTLLSAPTEPYSGTPLDDIPPRPATGVVAMDRPNDAGGAIVVSWDLSPDDGQGAADVVSYHVYRGLSSDSSTMAQVRVLPPGTTTFTDQPVNNGTVYFYRVRARDSRNFSVYSAADSAVAADNGLPSPPAPPSNLRALNPSPDGGRRIQLLWQRSPDDGAGTGVDGYRIYRTTTSGVYGAALATAAAGTTEYMDTTVVDLTPYYYRVTAFKGSLESLPSNEAGPVVSDDEEPPAPIRDLVATSGQVEGEVVLTWTAPGDDGMIGRASTYFLKYAADSIVTEASWFAATPITAGVPTPAPAGTVQSMTARGLPSGHTLWFCLRASDDRGNLASFSNPASALAQADVTPPGYVADLEATQEGALEGQVVLRWTATGDDGDVGTAARYDIRASLTPMATLPQFESGIPLPNPPTPKPSGQREQFVARGLVPNTKYYFRLRVFDDAGNGSPLSAQVSEFAQVDVTPPGRITDLAAYGVLPWLVEGQVLLRWTAPGDDGDSGGPASSYLLKYRLGAAITEAEWDSPSCVPVQVPFAPQLPGSPESLVVGGLTPGQWYYFAMRARDDRGNLSMVSNSPQALPQTDVTPPAQVTDLVASGNAPGLTEGQLMLTWTAVGDDSLSGTVSSYQFRYRAGGPVTEATWNSATVLALTQILRPPSLSPAGSPDTLIAKGLPAGTVLHFACRAFDERNNASAVSNSAWDTVQVDVTPPATITTLQALTGPTQGTLKARWVAVGDDSLSGGPASVYDLRYRVGGPITTEAQWQAATQVTGEPTPSAPGTVDSMIISGLPPDVVHYVAIRVADERGNWSGLSNSPGAASGPDVTPPPDVTSFTVRPDDQKLHLQWTPPTSSDYKGVLIGRRLGQPVNTNPVPHVDYDVSDLLPDGVSIVVYIGSGIQWTDTSVVNDSTYHYRAYSYDAAWNYSEGRQASGTPRDTLPPAPVTGFSARQVQGGIRLRWTCPSTTDFKSVMVRYGTTQYPATPTQGTLVGIEPGTPSTADSLLHASPAEQTYFYAAFAMDEVPNFSTAAFDSATYDITPPDSVLGFTVSAGNGADTLRWNNPPQPDRQGTIILRREGTPVQDLPAQGQNYQGQGSIGTSTIVAILGTAATQYVDTGLTNGQTYHYTVQAFDWRFNYSLPVAGSGTPGP